MARGWESKDVESQIEAREAERRAQAAPRPTPEEMERERRRESLELTRARVRHDLETAHGPRHRQQLEAALAYLETEIAKLGPRLKE